MWFKIKTAIFQKPLEFTCRKRRCNFGDYRFTDDEASRVGGTLKGGLRRRFVFWMSGQHIQKDGRINGGYHLAPRSGIHRWWLQAVSGPSQPTEQRGFLFEP